MKRIAFITLLSVLIMPAFADEPAAQQNLNAYTTDGTRVVLHPDGHWEYFKYPTPSAAVSKETTSTQENVKETTKDAAKETTEQTTKEEKAPAVSAQQGCPPGWQGGTFGLGRCIPPGDKDYNRGSLKPR